MVTIKCVYRIAEVRTHEMLESLTLAHTRGYGTRRVCLLPAMAASNGHKSETTSSIRGTGVRSVAFSDVSLLKSLSTKREARKVTEMV